jgi:hypothetical protein
VRDDPTTSIVLLLALGLAGLVFWRLNWWRTQVPPQSASAAAAGAPTSLWVPLGQNAVAPDRQWLLLPRGI